MIPHKFALIYGKKSSKVKNTGMRFASFLVFFFFGLGILALNWLVDIGIFIAHLYWHDLEYVDTKIKKIPDVNMRTYDKLNDFLKGKREAVLPYKKVAIEIREMMKVREGMRRLLRLDIFEDKADEDSKSVNTMKNAYLKA